MLLSYWGIWCARNRSTPGFQLVKPYPPPKRPQSKNTGAEKEVLPWVEGTVRVSEECDDWDVQGRPNARFTTKAKTPARKRKSRML